MMLRSSSDGAGRAEETTGRSAIIAASVGHVFSTKEMGVTGRVYWHDDGNRKEMAECLDRLIDVEIKVPEEETELMTPKKRTSNRRNLRNDEI